MEIGHGIGDRRHEDGDTRSDHNEDGEHEEHRQIVGKGAENAAGLGDLPDFIERILDILNLDGYCGIYTSWEHDTDDRKFIIVKTWGEPTYRLDLESLIVYKYGEYEKIEPTSWTYYLSIYNLLLENFFDVNGLIPKGLAYAVNNNNNPYKTKKD